MIKTKTILFYDEILYDNIVKLLTKFENAKQNRVNLYFASPGGDINLAEMLIEYLNHSDKQIKITVVGEVSSAGLIVLLKVKWPIQVLDTGYSICHLGTRQIDYRESLDEYSKSAFEQEALEDYNKHIISIYRECGISDKQIRFMEEGKSVLIKNDELTSIIASKKDIVDIMEENDELPF